MRINYRDLLYLAPKDYWYTVIMKELPGYEELSGYEEKCDKPEETNEITRPAHYVFDKPCEEVRDVIKDRLTQMSDLVEYEEDLGDLVYDYSNAIKYLLRWPFKNGLKDLYKTKECVEELIEILESKGTFSE